MKAFGRLLIGLLLLANLAFLAALSLHVVVGPGKFAVLPKGQLTLIDSYANTGKWSGKDDLTRHAALVARLVDTGHADLLPGAPNVTPAAAPAAAAAAPAAPSQAVTGTVKADATSTQHESTQHDKTIFDFDEKK